MDMDEKTLFWGPGWSGAGNIKFSVLLRVTENFETQLTGEQMLFRYMFPIAPGGNK